MGCKCCGNIYTPSRYYALIHHFKTKKHHRLTLEPANDISNAYEEKCKENRKLKQLNYNYKEEITMLRKELDKLKPDLISLI